MSEDKEKMIDVVMKVGTLIPTELISDGYQGPPGTIAVIAAAGTDEFPKDLLVYIKERRVVAMLRDD